MSKRSLEAIVWGVLLSYLAFAFWVYMAHGPRAGLMALFAWMFPVGIYAVHRVIVQIIEVVRETQP